MHRVLGGDDHEGRRHANPCEEIEKEGGKNHSSLAGPLPAGPFLARQNAGVYRRKAADLSITRMEFGHTIRPPALLPTSALSLPFQRTASRETRGHSRASRAPWDRRSGSRT